MEIPLLHKYINQCKQQLFISLFTHEYEQQSDYKGYISLI